MNILHGLTGSVASRVVNKFEESYRNDVVKFVLTKSAQNFNPPYYSIWKPEDKSSYIPEHLKWEKFEDKDEWIVYSDMDNVLHIDLVKWADSLLIAPCSANTLAKIANGICDNLLTCITRAWDFNKPFVIAPAMNTKMWNHPITQEHISKIKSWGILVVEPVEKTLFCGDVGMGAMADITNIIKTLKQL